MGQTRRKYKMYSVHVVTPTTPRACDIHLQKQETAKV
jgi:hypothetical protein